MLPPSPLWVRLKLRQQRLLLPYGHCAFSIAGRITKVSQNGKMIRLTKLINLRIVGCPGCLGKLVRKPSPVVFEHIEPPTPMTVANALHQAWRALCNA